MGKRIVETLSSVLMILCLVSSSWAFLSKEHPTHQNIVNQGIDLKKNVHKSDSDEGKEFAIWADRSSEDFAKGAHDEDSTTTGGKYVRSEPPLGNCGDGDFYSHYYNPVTGEGLWGAFNSAIQRVRDMLYEIQKIRGCPSERKEIPPELLAKLNCYFGKLMHLIAEMAVPDHTQDDGHLYHNRMENYVANNWESIINADIFKSNVNPEIYKSLMEGKENWTWNDPEYFMDSLAGISRNYPSDRTNIPVNPDDANYLVSQSVLATAGYIDAVYKGVSGGSVRGELDFKKLIMLASARADLISLARIATAGPSAEDGSCVLPPAPVSPAGDHPDDRFDVSDEFYWEKEYQLPEADLAGLFLRTAIKKGKIGVWYKYQIGQTFSDAWTKYKDASDEVKNALETDFQSIGEKLRQRKNQIRSDWKGAPDIALFANGFYNPSISLMLKLGEPVRFLDFDFDPAVGKDHPVLLVPTGGFYGFKDTESLKARLEEYVKNGGSLVVLGQQFGRDWGLLPVPLNEETGERNPVSGFGYQEDQSCTFHSVYIDTYHPILSVFSTSLANIGVDGYFTSYPEDTTVLLRRTANGQAAMILYPYGKGFVLASTLYSDFAFTHHQAGDAEIALVQNMISWAKKPGDLAEIRPGQEVAIPLEVTNNLDGNASSVKLTFLDPWRKVIGEQTMALSLPTGQSATLPVSFVAGAKADLGIYHVDYTLLDSQGNILQPQAETDSGRFAVSSPSPGKGPDKPIWFSVSAASQNVLFGTPMEYTFHVFNNTEEARTLTIRNYFRHTGRSHEWKVTALPNQETTLSGSDPFLDTMWMFETMEAVLLDETGKEVGRYELSFKGTYPGASLSVKADKDLYYPGGKVAFDVSLKNQTAFGWEGRVKTTVVANSWGSPRVIFEEQKGISLSAYGSGSIGGGFEVPGTLDWGTCFVQVEVWAGDRRVTSGSSAFEVVRSWISVEPVLPPALGAGLNQIAFSLVNKGRIPVSSAVLEISLKDPEGGVVASRGQPFSLTVGESKTLEVPLSIPPLKFGVYTLSYTQSDETRTGQPATLSFRNEASLSLSFDKPSYRAGEAATLSMEVKNTGKFRLESIPLSVSVPDAGYSNTRAVTVEPGQVWTAQLPVPILETMTAGQHEGVVSLSLSGGKGLERKGRFTIPESNLAIQYPGPGTLSAGDAVNWVIANTGGVGTQFEYTVSLWGAGGVTLYQNTVTDTIPAAGTKTYSFAIPSQAAKGTYRVRVEGIDKGTGRRDSLTRELTVSGLGAELSVKMGKEVYFYTESLQAQAHITNQTFRVENGVLGLKIAGACVPVSVSSPGEISVSIAPGPPPLCTVWQADIPVNLAGSAPFDLDRVVSSFNGNGQYNLLGTLKSATGQVLAEAKYAFNVVRGEVALVITPGKGYYRPGEMMTIAGRVMNLTGVEVPDVSLRVFDGWSVEIFHENFSLPAQGTHSFSFPASYSSEGSYPVYGKVYQGNNLLFTAEERYGVGLPKVSVQVQAPAVAGRNPFPLSLTLSNGGHVAAAVQWAGSGGTWSDAQSVILQPQETKLIQYRPSITSDTVYSFQFSGDYLNTISIPVAYAEKAALGLTPSPVNLEGRVTVPLAVTNSGQVEEAVEVKVELQQGAAVIRQETKNYYLAKGAGITDSLYFDLSEGDYQIKATSQVPAATAQAAFGVRKENKADLSVTVGGQSSGLIPVNVNLGNAGYNGLSGSVIVSVSGKDKAYWNGKQSFADLSPQGAQALSFNINPSGIQPGSYTLRAELQDNGGRSLVFQSVPLTIQGPVFQVTQVPPYQTVNPGEEATFAFRVKNTGNQEGGAELYFKSNDLIDMARQEWMKPGEEKEINFAFRLPVDLEEKDYFASWRLQTADGRPPTAAKEGQVKYHLAGINLKVNGALDKQNFREGETAHLALTITTPNSQLSTLNLFARVNYPGYEKSEPFTLGGPQSLSFDIPLPKITGEKLFYGIYHESGRSIHLNSLYVYKAGDAVSITADKQVYKPGETVTFTVKGEQPSLSGALTLSSLNYEESLPFNGILIRTFQLPATLTAGTYSISYQLSAVSGQQVNGSYPYDVDGIQVKVKEARLDKAQYAPSDVLQLSLNIESNQNLEGTLKFWIVEPDKSYNLLGTQAVNLSSSGPLLTAYSSPLTFSKLGLHRVVYGIYAGDLLLCSGAEAFDMGGAVILGLSPDQADYAKGTEAVILKTSLYGAGQGTLDFYLDGQQVASQPVSLSGFSTLEYTLPGVAPGLRKVKAVLTAAGLSAGKEASIVYGSGLPDLAVRVSSDLQADGKSVKLTVTVTNRGKASSAPTTLNLYDGPAQNGVLLASFEVKGLASGESQTFTQVLSTLGRAGVNEISAAVDPGGKVFEFNEGNNSSGVSFAVPDLNLAMSLGKAAYLPGELLTVDSVLTNLSRGPLSGLSLSTEVKDGAGVVVYSKIQEVQTLGPLSSLSLQTTWVVSAQLKEGIYTVTQQVQGKATAKASGSFEVQDPVKGITGTIAARPNPVYRGTGLTLSFTLTNQSASEMTGLKVRAWVVNPANGEVGISQERLVSLGPKGSLTDAFVVSTIDLLPGAYEAVLGVMGAAMDQPRELSRAAFQVVPALPVATWAKTLGGGLGEVAYAVGQTKDGGAIAGGMTESFAPGSAGNPAAWVWKMDASGRVEWQKALGSGHGDAVYGLKQIEDGGYLGVGEIHAHAPKGGDLWVWKMDSAGVVAWQKAYGSGWAMAVEPTLDGRAIVAGTGFEGARLLKLDGSGEVEWQRVLGRRGDQAFSVVRAADGGYVLAGGVRSFGNGGYDFWVVKVDGMGEVQWQRAYGGSGEGVAFSMAQALDGGYIVAGQRGRHAWALKIDRQGEVEWQRGYGGSRVTSAHSITQTYDGGYVLAGKIGAPPEGGRAWVMKVNGRGEIQWQRVSGGHRRSVAHGVIEGQDGGYLVAGALGNWGREAMLLKVDASGDLLACEEGMAEPRQGGAEPLELDSSTVEITEGGRDGGLRAEESRAVMEETQAVPLDLCSEAQPHISVYPFWGYLYFFDVPVGRPVTKQAVVFNRGRGDLKVEEVKIAPDLFNRFDAAQFSQKNDCSVVPPEGSCTIWVTFKPRSPGIRRAYLEILSNDPDRNPYRLGLMGTTR